jgi:hypothetical protein
MLNDHERNTLREFERRLLSEDPEFARSFDARAQRLASASPPGVGIKIFLVGGLLLSALVLVAGSLSGAVAIAVATGLVWLVWRLGPDIDRQPP